MDLHSGILNDLDHVHRVRGRSDICAVEMGWAHHVNLLA
jgi:hypothetical protein